MQLSVEFQENLRSWLLTNCPPSMRLPLPESEAPLGGRKVAPLNPETLVWTKLCAERGLTLPTVPSRYGGGGLTIAEANFFYEELDRLRMRIPLMGIGTGMLAPTLMQFGTEEQKLHFLPRIANGSDRWAQSFSEPGAGSDLASLQLSAVRDGDHYVLNGQKIWNSWADKADGLITLVRTDREAVPKQRGISFLLVPTDTPGVTIRPIRMINGESEFCEVFYDNARVPVANRLGAENDGWSVIKSFLVADRRAGRRWTDSLNKLDLVAVWREAGNRDPAVASMVTESELDELAIQLLLRRIDRLEAMGKNVDAFANVTKYWQAEHLKRRWDVATFLNEWRHAGWTNSLHSEGDAELTKVWLNLRAASLGGGSNEVQLNIIAKHSLTLPPS